MDFLKYKFKCKKCRFEFLGYGLPESSYGEFLLYTNVGEVRYLNAFEDTAFTEANYLFKDLVKNSNITPYQQSDIFQSLFGIIYDKSESGREFQVGLFAPCPICGSLDIDTWGEKIPLEVCAVDVEPVTHNKWDKLSDDEKVELIKDKVSEKIAIYEKQNFISKFQAKYPTLKMFLWILVLIIMFNILGPYLHLEQKKHIDEKRVNQIPQTYK